MAVTIPGAFDTVTVPLVFTRKGQPWPAPAGGVVGSSDSSVLSAAISGVDAGVGSRVGAAVGSATMTYSNASLPALSASVDVSVEEAAPDAVAFNEAAATNA